MAKGERKVTNNDDSSDDEQASDDDSDSDDDDSPSYDDLVKILRKNTLRSLERVELKMKSLMLKMIHS